MSTKRVFEKSGDDEIRNWKEGREMCVCDKKEAQIVGIGSDGSDGCIFYMRVREPYVYEKVSHKFSI